MFAKAGMTLEDKLNKVYVVGHHGPRPEAYHREIFDRLYGATKGLQGSAYTKKFKETLEKLGKEAATKGSHLNKLLTER